MSNGVYFVESGGAEVFSSFKVGTFFTDSYRPFLGFTRWLNVSSRNKHLS